MRSLSKKHQAQLDSGEYHFKVTPLQRLRAHVTRKNYIEWLLKQPPSNVVGSCMNCPIAYWLLNTLNITKADVNTYSIEVTWRAGDGRTTGLIVSGTKWLDAFIWWADTEAIRWERITAMKALEALRP